MNSKTEQKLIYPISLLLSSRRKTFEALGRSAGISGDTVLRLVEHSAATFGDLIGIANKVFKRRRKYLIIDDTLIKKIYSKLIEGTSDNYDSSDKKVYRSLCSVVAVITDGRIVIPVTQDIWTSKELHPDTYQTKWQIAQKLILQIQQELSIYMFLADGLYAVHEFLEWLCEKNINFEMKFHSNRVINNHTYTGQIKYDAQFKLSGKRTMRTMHGTWKGSPFYFTAFRRISNAGEVSVVFLISNYKASARDHVRAYEFRWVIEKFFRTAKQHLGLNDCQSRKLNLQKNHIMNVFFMYALLQIECKKTKHKTIESLIKSLDLHDFDLTKSLFMRSAENFGVA